MMNPDRVLFTENASKSMYFSCFASELPLIVPSYTSICSVIFYESFCVSACLLISPFLLECLFVSVYSVYPRFCDPDAFSMILFRSAVRIVCVHRDALTQRINSTVRRVLGSSNVSSRYM